ncbi:hypothetical protein CTAYLR_005854 [Chrysophaeum taylorii]|uniref:Carboxyl-terminal protease n=1 Tax=Chrysophaeum taylorii TaxID=2483200 RepID=A0AAD7UQF1_9STRA|nr:hypothetical protein CTAYLR_005854 [Chrysophaeum taylorii]
MLSSLDPYTEFEEPRAAAEMETRYEGRYGGVGLVIRKDGNEARVSRALERYAYEAGVRASDTLVAVDGRPTRDLGIDEVRDMLRGVPGTTASVEVRRAWKDETETVRLRRFEVREDDIELATLLDNDVAYARVSLFSRETAPAVRAALSGANAAILDLRGNPGGLLESAVEVASLFLPDGSRIVTAGSREGLTFEFKSVGVPPLGKARLAILVDGESASASEVVAGAVQDLDAGVIVGTNTFGKGLVQDVVDLPYGAKLKLTIGRYATPSGRSLQEINYASRRLERTETYRTRLGRPVMSGAGVTPDLVVESSSALSRPENLLVASGILDAYVDAWLRKKPEVAAALYEASLQDQTTPPRRIFAGPDLRDFERYALQEAAEGALTPGLLEDLFFYEEEEEEGASVVVVDEMEKRKVDVPPPPPGAGGRRRTRGLTTSSSDGERRRAIAAIAELKGLFRAKPARVQKLADAVVRSRFFRSSANLRVLLEEEDNQVDAAVAVLKDPRKYDAILAPPAKI